MKNIRILALFLSFILMVPVFTSLLKVDNPIDNFELTEKSDDKEQRQNRESDKEDEVQEFPLFDKNKAAILSFGIADFFVKRSGILYFKMDVLTPPPEFI